MLVANGVRLATVSKGHKRLIQPWVESLEKGRLCCRAIVLALLGLKRRRTDVLCKVDRWIVRELAIAVYATRSDVQWQ